MTHPTDALRLVPVSEADIHALRELTQIEYYAGKDEWAGALERVITHLTASASPLPEGGGWRDISTAPRKIEFRCLLSHPFSVITGYWDGEGWRNERSAAGHHFPATHWMPLPAAPTGAK